MMGRHDIHVFKLRIEMNLQRMILAARKALKIQA